MIDIRPADIDRDGPELVRLLKEHLTARSDLPRFRWFYADNPHGRGLAWFAHDTDKDLCIGSGSVIPRRVYVEGAERLVSVMADFWVHPDYRTLGPAVKLQRACIDGLASQAYAFIDYPQQSMSAVYKRLRLLGDDRLAQFARPLRIDHHLAKRLRSRTLGRIAGAPINGMLALRDALRSRLPDCDITPFEGNFGEEFTELAARVAPSYGVHVVRSAPYLNWRYREHYFLKHHVFVARRRGALRAYAITTATDDLPTLVDVFGEPDPGLIRELLFATASILRARGCGTLYASLANGHPFLPILREAGFSPRSEVPIVIHEYGRAAGAARRDWLLSYGDLDY
jgi:GNAT superfamily N-acetyltransferase